MGEHEAAEAGSPYPPIAAYGLLSDCHSAALVSASGSVDWCSFHRFEARPVFARLLDWGKGGHFAVAPAGPWTSSRRYLPETNLLETRFRSEGGVLELIDCLPIRWDGEREDPHAHPLHQLIRVARCLEGEVEVTIEFRPRFDYGLTTPRLELEQGGLAVVYGGADALVLQTDLPIEEAGVCSCSASHVLRAGEEALSIVTHSLPHELDPQRVERKEALERVETTRRFWERWSARRTYDGRYRPQVLRSLLVLKALTNSPTGAIAAAPTTSLPEVVGAGRNWDYRYTWLRDSALTLNALFATGCAREGHAYMAWLERTTAGRAEDVRIMYGVGGERLLPEVELDGLEGYRGSRPVRIGNEASNQHQLDVYGAVVDTAYLYARRGGEVEPAFWSFLVDVVDVVERRWRDPDSGIWEMRGEPRHFVYSKVMAWVAVDRAIRLAEETGLAGDLDRWRPLRDEIRSVVEAEGVDRESGAFTQSFGSSEVDASNLLIPSVGFVPFDDARAVATRRRVAAELSQDGLVLRYRGEDGLEGEEATFAICSFWLVENLARGGDVDDARALFERLLGFCNDLGLLAEEIDPGSGELLGNFPQAFSHLGLILAALALDEAEPGADGRATG